MRVLRRPVVRLDLRRVGVFGKAQRLDKALCNCGPVRIGIGDGLGVEISYRPVELAENFALGESLLRAIKSRNDVRDFLAKRGWTGRLPVCT